MDGRRTRALLVCVAAGVWLLCHATGADATPIVPARHVSRPAPRLSVAQLSCTRTGACRLAVSARNVPRGARLTLRIERLNVDDTTDVGPADDTAYRRYEAMPVDAATRRVFVRVSSGTYRARLLLQRSGAVVAESPRIAWRVAPIAAADGNWPIDPVDEQHQVRNGFGDARDVSFHHGIDIFVDDSHPEPDAPSWASHRVYAVRGGLVSTGISLGTASARACDGNRVTVGDVIYFHVVATALPGAYVAPGDPIGWSCRTRWHVHLTLMDATGSPTNPLAPGRALLHPWVDDVPPRVEQIVPYSACDGSWGRWRAAGPGSDAVGIVPCGRKLDPMHLAGLVDVRFRTTDMQPKTPDIDVHPWMYASLNPYAAWVRLEPLDPNGNPAGLTFDRVVYRADHLNDLPPLTVLWAPGLRRWEPIWQCPRFMRAQTRLTSCSGAHWYRAFSAWPQRRYLDTTTVPNGRYRLTMTVEDHGGNYASASIDTTVANGPSTVSG